MHSTKCEVKVVGDDLIITNILPAGKRTDTQVHQLLRKVESLLRVPQGFDAAWREQFEQLALEETSNPSLTVGQLADRMNLSVSTLGRLCYRVYGLSPMKYVFNLRLERAALLLTQNYGRVKDVAYETGFSSLSYFSKCYKERYGVPPRTVLSGQVA